MLRIIKKKDLLYFTEQPRRDFDLGRTELLYTFEDLKLDDGLLKRIRPWRWLGRKTVDYYKIDLLQYIPEVLYSAGEPDLIAVSREDVEAKVRKFESVGMALGMIKEKKELPEDYELQYDIDIPNALEDIYGSTIVRLVYKFFDLGSGIQETILKIHKIPGKNRALEIAKSDLGEEPWIYEPFLPEPIIEDLRLLGNTGSIGQTETPEYLRQEIIGQPYPDLENEIYKEFRLGEELMDGAESIKQRLGIVYTRCGMAERTPAAKDLEEWFVVTPCWSKGKRGLRLDLRRTI